MMKKIISILFCAVVAVTINVNATSADVTPKNAVEVSTTVNVWGGNGVVTFSNPLEDMTFVIYSITGQALKSVVVPVGTTTMDIPKGFYIIKCNLWSRKVIVK